MSGSTETPSNIYEQLIATLGVTFFIVCMIFSIIIAVLVIVAMWKIFKKAGEPGWKAIVPFYNSYTLFKIVWDTKFFWINLGFAVLSGIISFLPAIGWLGSIISIASFVLTIMVLNKLAKSFGHGTGFTIGLIFLPYIFFLILGLGGDEFSRVD